MPVASSQEKIESLQVPITVQEIVTCEAQMAS